MSKLRDASKRYQHQPWYVRLWRRRHLLSVPIRALRSWARMRGSFRNCWALEVGMAHVRMNWLYDWAEIAEMLAERE